MAVLYNVYLIIARATFVELQEKYSTVWFVLDYICDFVYIVDIIVQFRTGNVYLHDVVELYRSLCNIHAYE